MAPSDDLGEISLALQWPQDAPPPAFPSPSRTCTYVANFPFLYYHPIRRSSGAVGAVREVSEWGELHARQQSSHNMRRYFTHDKDPPGRGVRIPIIARLTCTPTRVRHEEFILSAG